MTADAVDTNFLRRLIAIEEQKREAISDIKDLVTEMKSHDISKERIAGIRLASKRHFEGDEKRAVRMAAEEIADALASSGNAPLFSAAIQSVSQRVAI